MGTGDLGRAFDTLLAGVGMAKGDVGCNRVREEEVLLEDHADLLAERLQWQRAHIVPVEQDATVAGVVEARDEREERGLARPRGTSDGDALPGLSHKVHILKYRGVLVVLEGDVIKAHAAKETAGRTGVGLRSHARISIENLKDPFGTRERDLRVVDHGGHGGYLRGELLE